MPLVEFRKILPLFKDGIGDTIEDLNSTFSNFHELGKRSRFEMDRDRLVLTNSTTIVNRPVPVVLTAGAVFVSYWEVAELILVFKEVIISDIVPLDLKKELTDKLIKVPFLEYEVYYDRYFKEIQRVGSGSYRAFQLPIKFIETKEDK